MAKTKVLPLLLTMVLLTTACAEDEKGFFGKIADAVKSFLSRAGLISTEKEIAYEVVITCMPSFVRINGKCCLDDDKNGICDSDETTTTLTTTSTTTTTTTTTSTSTSTTSTTSTITGLPEHCSTNKDCGETREERICYQGDVYLKREVPICQRPRRPDSRCILKITGMTDAFGVLTPAEKCADHCIDRKCVSES